MASALYLFWRFRFGQLGFLDDDHAQSVQQQDQAPRRLQHRHADPEEAEQPSPGPDDDEEHDQDRERALIRHAPLHGRVEVPRGRGKQHRRAHGIDDGDERGREEQRGLNVHGSSLSREAECS
jgi:hypothetical protein